MNYIILDMEWNQAFDKTSVVREPVLLHGEIIQIGAVKTDDSFGNPETIKINVAPRYYRKMNRHVEKITGITSEQLASGESFPDAFARFKEWCGEDFRFITWGFDDISMLRDNLALYNIDPSWVKDYVNLQLIYKNQIDNERTQRSLSDAMEKLDIHIEAHAHDAMNDAYFTYEICRKLDMQKGLAEYSGMSAGERAVLCRDYIRNIREPKKVLSDIRVTSVPCPNCQKELELYDWLYFGGGRRSTIGRCDLHGEFLIKLSCKQASASCFTAIRTVYTADEKSKATYQRKIERQRSAFGKKADSAGKETDIPAVLAAEKTRDITTVMFDLDGTLLPYEQKDFVKAYFGELCKKLSCLGYEPEPTVKSVWAGTGAMMKNDGTRLNSEVFWETFYSLNKGKPDAKPLCDEFYTLEFDRTRSVLKYIPDHRAMIDRLKAAGLTLVLATNPVFPLNGVATRMKWAGLAPEDFALVTHYDNCRFCKPDPRYYEEIMSRLGVVPEKCVMVGNNVNEDMCAAALGITTFLVPEFLENPQNEDYSSFPQGTIAQAESFILERVKK